MTQHGTQFPKVTIVIPTWNRKDDVLRCAASLRVLDYPNLFVIIVDNGSEDGTADALREQFPGFLVLRNEKNLGYAAGNNVGIRRALANGAQHVVLVNNDSEVTPGLVTELVRVAESDPQIAVVGARNILMEDQTRLWGAYVVLTYGPYLAKPKGRHKKDGPRWQVVKDVGYVIGNGCLWTRRALTDIGLLDETFFAYHEDLDWCMRARRAGYRVVYTGTAALVHKGGSSSDDSQQHFLPIRYFLGRNGVRFVRRYARWYQQALFASSCAAAIPVWLAVGLGFLTIGMTKSKRQHGIHFLALTRTFIRGLLDGIRGRPIPFAALGMTDSATPHPDAANPERQPAEREARP